MFAKQNPGKPRVRFPDELVFNDNVKEQDIPAVEAMLRRSSLQMDINSINSAGIVKKKKKNSRFSFSYLKSLNPLLCYEDSVWHAVFT